MSKVTNKNGFTIDFETATDYMNDDLRNLLSDLYAPCSDQLFFDIYEIAHAFRFDEEWELSKANPCF